MEVQKISCLTSYLTLYHPRHCQGAQDGSLTLSSCWLLAPEVEECWHLEAYKQVQKDQGLKKTSWLSVSCFWTQTVCSARPNPACGSCSLADGYVTSARLQRWPCLNGTLKNVLHTLQAGTSCAQPVLQVHLMLGNW